MTALRSLWPSEIKADIKSPKQILSEQATALTEATHGILVGLLQEDRLEDDRVRLTLKMVAPALKYQHGVLTATYSNTRVYPVLLDADVFRPRGLAAMLDLVQPPASLLLQTNDVKSASQADSDEELIALIRKVLTSPSIVSVAQSLVARSNELTAPVDFLNQLEQLPEPDRRASISRAVDDAAFQLLDRPAFVAAVKTVGTAGWGLDRVEVTGFRLEASRCVAAVAFDASIEPGTEGADPPAAVIGTAEAIINRKGDVEFHSIQTNVVSTPNSP